MRKTETNKAETSVVSKRSQISSAASSSSRTASSRNSLRTGTKASRSKTMSRRQRVKRRLELAGPKKLLVACCVLGASVLLGAIMTSNYSDFRTFNVKANAKAQQLRALQGQHEDMKRRLAFLQLPKGREQVLVEHGYLKPGDRILLFPHEKPVPKPVVTQATRKTPENEAPVNSAVASQNEGSAWSRASNSLSRWWNDVNRASARGSNSN